MKTTKHLGIWMDHANAHLMELTNGPIKTITINAALSHQEKESTLEKSEKGMHQKEIHETSAYYKQLGKTMLNYDDVLLFGPTDAKTELFNLLRTEHNFDNIKIQVKPADKMTENQEHAFIREHFAKA